MALKNGIMNQKSPQVKQLSKEQILPNIHYSNESIGPQV